MLVTKKRIFHMPCALLIWLPITIHHFSTGVPDLHNTVYIAEAEINKFVCFIKKETIGMLIIWICVAFFSSVPEIAAEDVARCLPRPHYFPVLIIFYDCGKGRRLISPAAVILTG